MARAMRRSGAARRIFVLAASVAFVAMSGFALAACSSERPEKRREEAPRAPDTLPDPYKHPPR